MFEVLAMKASSKLNVHVILYRLDEGHDNHSVATCTAQGVRQDQGEHRGSHQVRHEREGGCLDWSAAGASACLLSTVKTRHSAGADFPFTDVCRHFLFNYYTVVR